MDARCRRRGTVGFLPADFIGNKMLLSALGSIAVMVDVK
jgi:hypothetical protein